MKSKKEIKKQIAADHPGLSEFEVAMHTQKVIKTTAELSKGHAGSIRTMKITKNKDGTVNVYNSTGDVKLNHSPKLKED